MTTRTTKTYALFAIVPLLLAGFGGNSIASAQSTSYNADKVDGHPIWWWTGYVITWHLP